MQTELKLMSKVQSLFGCKDVFFNSVFRRGNNAGLIPEQNVLSVASQLDRDTIQSFISQHSRSYLQWETCGAFKETLIL